MTDQPYYEQTALHRKAPLRAALLTYPGNLQKALRKAHEDPKKTLFGVAQAIPSAFVTKVLASAQPDFIWMDVEHAMFDRLTLNDAIHAAQHHSEGQTIPKHDDTVLATALDAGASGIVIPHCESAEDVKNIINKVYYPPIGHRSFSPWTSTPGISDISLYKEDPLNMITSNRHVVVIPQVETVKGIENVDEIAAVEGVGALMFGPVDFSADAGIPLTMSGDPHPTLAAAVGKLSAVGKKYARPLFGGEFPLNIIPMMRELGYGAIYIESDIRILANKTKEYVTKAREIAQQSGADGSAESNSSE